MFHSKKQDPFFISLLNIAQNVNEAAHYADEFRINSVADVKDLSIKMKNYETEGNKLVHEITSILNKSFMTPIEREDILHIAINMDNVMDGIEHFAAHLEMYSLEETDESMRSFMGYIAKITDEILGAVKLLANKKLHAMFEHAVKIKSYKRICDETLRISIKQLFITEKDPIKIIQSKDIYEQLQDIAIHCQDVANTIEFIIMRNA